MQPPPRKTARMDITEMADLFNTAMEQRDKEALKAQLNVQLQSLEWELSMQQHSQEKLQHKLEEKIKVHERELSRHKEVEQKLEVELKLRELHEHNLEAELKRHERELSRHKEHEQNLEAELKRHETKIARLEVYEQGSTCQKVATCDAIQFVVNLLSWKLRRLIHHNTQIRKFAYKEDLFGENKAFCSWNSITYSKLTWDLFWDWKERHSDRTILDYWTALGYTGSSLRQPEVERRKRQKRDTAQISDYLSRAEEEVAKEIGIDKSQIKLLCVVYVTCMHGERNEDAHLFAMHEPIWSCDVSVDQEEAQWRELRLPQVPPLVPVTKLKQVAKGPKIKVMNLWQLRTKLAVLRKVVSHSELAKLADYFQIFKQEIQKVGLMIQAAIGKSAGLSIRRMSSKRGVSFGQRVGGTSLRWTDAGVRDTETGAEFITNSDGTWVSTTDGVDFDPTTRNLFG